MKRISFQKIKDKIVTEFYSMYSKGMFAQSPITALVVNTAIERMKEGKPASIHTFAPELKKNIIACFDNMDIRVATSLIPHFPKAFPSFIKNNHYAIDMDDSGWYFYDTNSIED